MIVLPHDLRQFARVPAVEFHAATESVNALAKTIAAATTQPAGSAALAHSLADAPEVNALYVELFPEGRRPARTMYQAAALPFGGRVKVMGVAIKERARRRRSHS